MIPPSRRHGKANSVAVSVRIPAAGGPACSGGGIGYDGCRSGPRASRAWLVCPRCGVAGTAIWRAAGRLAGFSLAEIASREQLAAAIADPVRTVVTAAGWKFNCSAAGEHELYHLGRDPLETTNLAATAGAAAIRKDLARAIRRWQVRTGDAVTLPGDLLESN